jgi:hypothetical protein
MKQVVKRGGLPMSFFAPNNHFHEPNEQEQLVARKNFWRSL